MIKNILIGAALGGLLTVSVSACNGGSQNIGPIVNTGSAASYIQIELLSRPAVKEAFESFADHDPTNRAEPYNDQTIQNDIVSFAENTAGRSATTANTLKAVLYPNEMQIDLSSSATTAGYLGVETGGKVGTTFGGRSLTDDTIDVSLSAIFGNALSALGVAPDDGKESPCLATDNLPAAVPAYQASSTFPYSQGPV
jgi:hypothetical protein